MNQITDDLYITDIDTLSQTQIPADVTCVVSVCQDTAWDNVSDDVYKFHVALADDPESRDNWGGSCNYRTFARAVLTLLSALEIGPTVVHCHHGRNRSAAVAAATVSITESVGPDTSLMKVAEANPRTDVNHVMQSHLNRCVQEQVSSESR